MNEIETLIPREVKVTIGKKDYYIKKLSLKQMYNLLRMVNEHILSDKDKIKEIGSKTKDSKDELNDLMIIINLLPEDRVLEFFGIILKEKDMKSIEDVFGVEDILEILSALLECHDIEKLKKNFLQIATKIKGLMKPEKQKVV